MVDTPAKAQRLEVIPCPPLPLQIPTPRADLSPRELDELTYQVEQLDRAELAARARPAKPEPEPEQLSLLLDVHDARGALLCALARSTLEHERTSAHTIVRRSLELHGSTIPAAAALNVSERWIQTLIKQHPALCQGLALRKPGRPPKDHDDDKPTRMDPRMHAR